jgi:poly-gamma-glutamate synthesis protein (capsule biosynthesis protein)
MVHWGIENTPVVTDKQREFARWLVDHGVDVIVGSHPHCVQPLDYYHGRTIAYSLGNLVFDGAPTIPSWNHGALLQITLSNQGKVQSSDLIPVVLENGFPLLVNAALGVLARQ